MIATTQRGRRTTTLRRGSSGKNLFGLSLVPILLGCGLVVSASAKAEIVADMLIELTDVCAVAVGSRPVVQRATLTIRACAGTPASVQSIAWPTTGSPLPAEVLSVSLTTDTLGPAAGTPEQAAASRSHALQVLDQCRQHTLIAENRPTRYKLSLRVKVANIENVAITPGPHARFWVSNEIFDCRLERIE